MKKNLAIILSLVLLLSMSVPAFAAEVENTNEIMPRTNTLIDSFTLSADVDSNYEYTSNYTGYSKYVFQITELGVTGASYALYMTLPSASGETCAQPLKFVDANHYYNRTCSGSGNYRFRLWVPDSSITGVVLHVRVYGVS